MSTYTAIYSIDSFSFQPPLFIRRTSQIYRIVTELTANFAYAPFYADVICHK